MLKMRSNSNLRPSRLILPAFMLFLGSLPAVAADTAKVASKVALENAVKSYLENDYGQARSDLEDILKKEPNNGQAHFYLGLAEVRLSDKDGAEKDFKWVVDHEKDPVLKGVAQIWVGRLDRMRKGWNHGKLSPPVVDPNHGPVSKVILFYTNWCPMCRGFETPFEQAKGVFKKIKFEKYNTEMKENWPLVAKYDVKAYPTLVYIDDTGKIIENFAGAPQGSGFAVHLRQLGAK